MKDDCTSEYAQQQSDSPLENDLPPESETLPDFLELKQKNDKNKIIEQVVYHSNAPVKV